jgi:hypothetical protein
MASRQDVMIIDVVLVVVVSFLNGLTIYHLLRFGSLAAITTRLILYLHISVFINILGLAPMVFNGNDEICSYIGFIGDYADLSNIMGVALLTTVYYNFVVEKPHRNVFVRKYGFFIVFIFPLFVMLYPIITRSYVATSYYCLLDWDSPNGVLSSEIQDDVFIATLFYETIAFGRILFYSRSEEIMSKRLLYTVGIYITWSWMPWITELILFFIQQFTEVPDITYYLLFGSVNYSRPVVYVLCFVYSYSLFMNYEMEADSTRSSSLPISFAAFEAAVSNIRYNDDYEEDGNSTLSSSLLSHDQDFKANHILDVSANSESENSNELIKAYLERTLKNNQNNNNNNNSNPPSYAQLEQEDRTDDSTENPMISNGRIISTGSVLEVGRQSFDDDDRHN